jgi:hypothetical protein
MGAFVPDSQRAHVVNPAVPEKEPTGHETQLAAVVWLVAVP